MANPLYQGLLGPVGQNSGLFGMDPQTSGLVAAAQALGQQSGPSRMPQGTGSMMANALAAGAGGYRQAQLAGLNQQMNKMKFDAAKRAQAVAGQQAIYQQELAAAQATGNPELIRAATARAYPGKAADLVLAAPKRPAPGMVWNPDSRTWGMDPAYTAHKLEIATAGKPTTTVNMQQEKEEKKAFGKSLVSTYDAIADRADSAETARQQIAMGRGFVGEGALPSVLKQTAGNAAVAMGFDVKNLEGVLGNIGDGQGFTATMQNLVLSKMQAQKGPQTESDTRLIQKTVASLGNTPDARDFLLRASDALAQADVMKADFWRRWRNGKGKGSFDGSATAWRKFRNKVPFMAMSPATGKHVFFAEFADANRHKTFDEIVGEWSKNYAKTQGSR
jgi:hypothetical protein